MTTEAFIAWLNGRFGLRAGSHEHDDSLIDKMKDMGVGLPDETEPNLRPLLEEHVAYLLGRQPLETELFECARAFRSSSRRRLALLPGVISALKELREKYIIGLVSNAQELFTRAEIELLGLTGLFSFELLSSEVGFRKPAHQMFERALQEAKVKANEALYIGNDPFADIDGADLVGMFTCRVRDPLFEGLYSKNPPSLFVERVSELPLLLCGEEVPQWVLQGSC